MLYVAAQSELASSLCYTWLMQYSDFTLRSGEPVISNLQNRDVQNLSLVHMSRPACLRT